MKQEVTGQMIVKLPKWAQVHIKELARERETAIRALNEYVDGQAESPIFYDDLVSSGEEVGPSLKRVYIQSHKVEIVHNGVHLSIWLRDHIDLQWGHPKRASGVNTAFIPTSLQAASLVAKENMS